MKQIYTFLVAIILAQPATAQIDIYFSDAYSVEEKCAREAEQYEPEKEAAELSYDELKKIEQHEKMEEPPEYHDAYESCLKSYESEL